MAVILIGALATGGCAHHRSGAAAARGKSDPAFSDLVTPTTPALTAVRTTANLQPPSTPELPKNQKLIVTPETGLAGKVASFNTVGRFVVLNFPVGHLPAIDQQLTVFRLGLRVGEVKVTNLRNDDYVVADLVTGEAAAGDLVRDK
jgi:hypothetical protein